MITVFTPTYNRANLLPRVYESLCNLDLNFDVDFNQKLEWLMVDDGSTDNTREVVEEIYSKHTAPFAIRYIYKKNGGKHTAVNVGVQEAKGELFFILDSDDYLPSDALKIVAEEYTKIKDDAAIGGVAGLDCFVDGRVVGNGLPSESINCNAMDIRYKYHVTGDMKEVFRTEVLKEFPFPEIEGERFCPEALVWNRIAKKYKLHYFNKPIYIAEYQEGGITSGITRARMNSPIASMMTYAELFDSNINSNPNFNLPFEQKVKAAINYWRFAFCAKDRKVKIKGWGNLLAPLGYLMHLRDRRKVKL